MLDKLERRSSGSSPAVERSRWMDWARANGLKVIRHEKPVLPVM